MRPQEMVWPCYLVLTSVTYHRFEAKMKCSSTVSKVLATHAQLVFFFATLKEYQIEIKE